MQIALPAGWIDEPHRLLCEVGASGTLVVGQTAGDTLLWFHLDVRHGAVEAANHTRLPEPISAFHVVDQHHVTVVAGAPHERVALVHGSTGSVAESLTVPGVQDHRYERGTWTVVRAGGGHAGKRFVEGRIEPLLPLESLVDVRPAGVRGEVPALFLWSGLLTAAGDGAYLLAFRHVPLVVCIGPLGEIEWQRETLGAWDGAIEATWSQLAGGIEGVHGLLVQVSHGIAVGEDIAILHNTGEAFGGPRVSVWSREGEFRQSAALPESALAIWWSDSTLMRCSARSDGLFLASVSL